MERHRAQRGFLALAVTASAIVALALGLRSPAALLHAGEAQAGTPKGKFKNPFFAFCMDTHDAKKRTLREQAELLKELGYQGAGHLWLDDVPERLKTLDAAGLKLFQIYVRASVDPAQPPYDEKLKEVLPLLKGRETMIALLLSGGKPSDPSGDARAVKIVGEIAGMAQASGLRVALYPHSGDWLERVEDALRVVKKVGRENVGVMLNLCHWLKVDDEKNLKPLLESAMPHLFAVSINGADQAVDIKSGKGQWIQPLGSGSFDMFGFLKTLSDLGYRGPIGLQCYGLPGDARDHLKKSMDAWRKLCDRLNQG